LISLFKTRPLRRVFLLLQHAGHSDDDFLTMKMRAVKGSPIQSVASKVPEPAATTALDILQ